MKKIYWWLIVSLLAVLFGLIYIYCLPSRGEIIFFNVGQGDAALIKLENGLKVLVDCGPNEIILSKLGRALPFYETRLDYLIISHPDLDHYGGCLAVIKRYKVSHVVINGDNKSDEYGRAFFARLAEEGSKVSVIDRFTRWQAGDAFFDFLAPSLDFGELSGNDRSVVFLFTHPQVKVLFTGTWVKAKKICLWKDIAGWMPDARVLKRMY